MSVDNKKLAAIESELALLKGLITDLNKKSDALTALVQDIGLSLNDIGLKVDDSQQAQVKTAKPVAPKKPDIVSFLGQEFAKDDTIFNSWLTDHEDILAKAYEEARKNSSKKGFSEAEVPKRVAKYIWTNHIKVNPAASKHFQALKNADKKNDDIPDIKPANVPAAPSIDDENDDF